MQKASATNTRVNAPTWVPPVFCTEVFVTNTEVFVTNTEVFVTNTEVFVTNTEVFVTNTEVFVTNTGKDIGMKRRIWSY